MPGILDRHRSHLPLPPAGRAFPGFIVWQGVCLSCGGAFDRWSAIRLASYILLYAYVRNGVERKPLFLCLFCAGLLQGLWGLLQAETILPARHYLFSMTGCFSNSAPWGTFLTLSLLSGLSLYSKNFSVPAKILWGSGVLFLLLCIFLSASRASWIALLGGSYWLLPSSLRQHLGRRLKATWRKSPAAARILIPVSALLPTCLLLYNLYALRSDSVSGRLLIWQVIHNSDTASYNWNKFMDAGLAANFLKKYRNEKVEYSVSLDNENGKYTMTEPYTVNKLDNVPLRFGEYTEAAVHNHPRSNPPSISDVLTLAKMNERSNGKFESSFIVPKTGPIYVLQITDKAKAYNFYELYKNKTSELETKRTEYLAWLISNGGGTFPEKEFDGYSLAVILQEIDCGISLLQVEGDSKMFWRRQKFLFGHILSEKVQEN